MPTRRFLLPLLAVVALAIPSHAQTRKAKDGPVKILFVGNSYTGGIRKMMSELVKNSPHSKSQISFINPGGKTLEFHLKNKKTTDLIRNSDFDFVVLQDQSQFPAVFPDRTQKAAIGLDQIIDKSGAKTVFYETWGRRDGDKMNKKRFPTFEPMQKALSKTYQAAAEKCDALLAPVGTTWSAVRKKNPKLGKELYRNDGSHPSGKGAYLAACVFYTTFFQEDPRKLTFTGGLPEAEAKLIREAAFASKRRSL